MAVESSFTRTGVFLALALAAVLATGTFISKRFLGYVDVPCRGRLEQAPTSELSGGPRSSAREVEVEVERYTTKEGFVRLRKPPYVTIKNPDGVPCCVDLTLPASVGSESAYRVEYDAKAMRYAVIDLNHPVSTSGGVNEHVVAVRRFDRQDTRFDGSRIVAPQNVSMLVFLFALGALGLGAVRLAQARPYASRMRGWRAATLRDDGVVESETGATLGRVAPGSKLPAGDVIVNPAAFEERDVYREVPILTKKTVGAGGHERWTRGTERQLRDARALVVITTAATSLALLARWFVA